MVCGIDGLEHEFKEDEKSNSQLQFFDLLVLRGKWNEYTVYFF